MADSKPADIFDDDDEVESPPATRKPVKNGKKAAVKPKAEKKAKPTAADKKQAKLRDQQVKKEKKKTRKFSRFLLRFALLLILLALIGAFCYLSVTMDFLGTRTWFIEQVQRLDPAYNALAELSAELEAREKALNEREVTITTTEEKLNKRSTDLDKRETELTDNPASTRSFIFSPPMSDEDTENMRMLGKIYAAMEAEKASAILLRLYNIEETAAILYYMPVKNSSAILAVMDPDRAARITEILLEA